MTSVYLLETVCAQAWPAVVTRSLGAWRLRASGGYTGRANSALAVGDPGVPVTEALSLAADFAVSHGIAPAAQVVAGSTVEAQVAAAGWVVNLAHPKGAESAVMVKGAESFVPAGRAEVFDTPPPGWFALVVGCPPTDAQRHVLTSAPHIAYAAAHRDGELIGAARGCLVDGYLHVSVVEVAHHTRRQGVAKSLLAALDEWADGLPSILQVAVHNAPALALYHSLGYTESHRYRYWIPTPTGITWSPT